MAERKVTFLISANVEAFNKNLKKAQKNFERMASKISGMGQELTRKVSLPLAAIGGVSIKTAADFERLRVQLDTLVGSAAEGEKAFNKLQKLSAGTPFQFNDLVKANNTLLGFGQSADQAYDALNVLGDIAAVTGADLQSVAVAFGQSSAEGKLFTRDIRQFINQGIPVIQLLADELNVAQGEIMSMAEDGKISFEILNRAFASATAEGGKFANGMEKQSKTLSGLFSTLRDNVSIALGQLGQDIVDTFNLKEVIVQVTNSLKAITERFRVMSKETKAAIITVAAAIGAGGPLLIAIGALSSAISGLIGLVAALTSPFTLTAAAITGLFVGVVVVGQNMVDNWENIKANLLVKLKKIQLGFKYMALGAMQALRAFIDFILNKIPPVAVAELFGIDVTKMVKDVTGIDDAIDSLKQSIGDGNDAILEAMKKASQIDTVSMGQSARNALEKTKAAIIAGLQGIMNSETIAKLKAQIAELLNFSGSGTTASTENPVQRRQVGSSMQDNAKRTIETNFSSFQKVDTEKMDEVKEKTVAQQNALMVLTDIANNFTNSFGQGMANIIVAGQRVVDVLKNIGKLLLSSAIQKGISILLTGGLSGEGFFGSGGGLFGKLFGGIFHSGGVVPGVGEKIALVQGGETIFTPDQMKMLSNTGMTGMQNIRVHISGDFKQYGPEMRATLTQTDKILR